MGSRPSRRVGGRISCAEGKVGFTEKMGREQNDRSIGENHIFPGTKPTNQTRTGGKALTFPVPGPRDSQNADDTGVVDLPLGR